MVESVLRIIQVGGSAAVVAALLVAVVWQNRKIHELHKERLAHEGVVTADRIREMLKTSEGASALAAAADEMRSTRIAMDQARATMDRSNDRRRG